MSNILGRWTPIGILLCLCLLPDATAQEIGIPYVGGGMTFRRDNQRSISHGHVYLAPKAPGFVFGGIGDTQDKIKLNYLILIKHKSMTTFERGNYLETSKDSDSPDKKTRLINLNDRISFGKSSLTYSYQAELDPVNDHLISEGMTFQGKPIDLTDGRVFVVDMTASPAEVQQINIELPTEPNLDFVNRTSEFKTHTNRWFQEISKNSEIVAKAFEDK